MGQNTSTDHGGAAGSILQSFALNKPHKMVFVANMALKMGAGKMAAQVGHAAVALYRAAQRNTEGQKALEQWARHGEMKVVIKGESAEQLAELYEQARQAGLLAYIVQDAGHTQIPAGSRTVLGIFGPRDEIDKITGHLKLY